MSIALVITAIVVTWVIGLPTAWVAYCELMRRKARK